MDYLLGPGIVCSPDLDNEEVGWSDGSMKDVGLNTVRIQIGCKFLRRVEEETDDSLVDNPTGK